MISAPVRIDGAASADDRIDSLCSPYQLFHDERLAVAGRIPACRMERCRRDLSDPGAGVLAGGGDRSAAGVFRAADLSRGLGCAAHGMSPADHSRATATATGGSKAVAVAR